MLKINVQVNSKKKPVKKLPAVEKIFKTVLCSGISDQFAKKIINPLKLKTRQYALKKDASETETVNFLKNSLCNLVKIKPPVVINEKIEALHAHEKPQQQKIIMFMGPGGCGKTTTIAKIAAKLVLEQKKKAAIFTLDPFRVEATHQISMLADIIGIPYEVVHKLKDLQLELEKYETAEYIFCDMINIGRQKSSDETYIKEFASEIKKFNPEIYLLLPADMKLRDLWKVIIDFSIFFKLHGLIFTHVDTIKNFDEIFAIAVESELPIAYLCNGQNIPQDIFIPTPEYIIEKLMQSNEIERRASAKTFKNFKKFVTG